MAFDRKPKFQFHKVRLKGIGLMAFDRKPKFQFHKVRLKVLDHYSEATNYSVSIP